MRLAFRRSALFAAVSLIAVGAATTALAQPVADTPLQDEQAQPEAEPTTLSQALPSASGQQSEPQAPPPLIDKIHSPEPDNRGEEEPFITIDPAEEGEGEADLAYEAEEEAPVIAIPAEWSPVPTNHLGRSAFGQYLAGRYALRQGATREAAPYLEEALALTPEQPLLREQVFSSSVLGGRIATAAGSIPNEADVSPFLAQTARLVAPVQAFSTGDVRGANAQLKAAPVEMPHDRAGLYLQVWIAAAAGDWDRALAAPPTGMDVVSTLLARGNRAALLEHRRLYAEAEAEWQELTSHAVASRLFRLPYGQFLERRGRRDDAMVQYQAAVTAGAADRNTLRAIARVEAKGRAPALVNYRTGAAQALVTAADQASAQDAHQFAIIYLRLAQAITPTEELSLQIGQTMRQAKLERQAREEFATVGTERPILYGAARFQMAMSYQESEDYEAALVELDKAQAIAPTDLAVTYAKATLLLQMKRYDEALVLLNGPVMNHEGQGFETYFLRGAAYSWLHQDEAAEANLWQALQLQPNNATVLNHLGYQWVNRGNRVAEGAAMIARAHAANPDDGNIQDSLGWAQFRQGLFDEAVVNLEGAVAKEPANPEINDHLGDAYWMIGRHREAGFQWQRVLSLEAEAERRETVEAKLKLEPGDALPPLDKPSTPAQ